MYLYFFSKTYRILCESVLLVRCNQIMLKGFEIEIFEIKYVHELK